MAAHHSSLSLSDQILVTTRGNKWSSIISQSKLISFFVIKSKTPRRTKLICQNSTFFCYCTISSSISEWSLPVSFWWLWRHHLDGTGKCRYQMPQTITIWAGKTWLSPGDHSNLILRIESQTHDPPGNYDVILNWFRKSVGWEVGGGGGLCLSSFSILNYGNVRKEFWIKRLILNVW